MGNWGYTNHLPRCDGALDSCLIRNTTVVSKYAQIIPFATIPDNFTNSAINITLNPTALPAHCSSVRIWVRKMVRSCPGGGDGEGKEGSMRKGEGQCGEKGSGNTLYGFELCLPDMRKPNHSQCKSCGTHVFAPLHECPQIRGKSRPL